MEAFSTTVNIEKGYNLLFKEKHQNTITKIIIHAEIYYTIVAKIWMGAFKGWEYCQLTIRQDT